MSRLAYLDCIGGLAGDMLLAALLDAGASRDALLALPQQLGLAGVGIAIERVERQGIGALHVRIEDSESVHRDPHEVRDLVENANLPEQIRRRAVDVLARLAEVEARVHGISVEDVHFHELGAVDMIIDVCGALSLFEDLGVRRVVCSPLPFARGITAAAHGVLPLPAPATLALLEGVPLVGVDGNAELVTPTGAAIAAVVVDEWGLLPPLQLEGTGYGAGSADLQDRPNLVRVVLGVPGFPSTCEVVLVETNLDDLSPELVPDAVEKCFTAGALDVWTVPAQMKKARPGIVLSALTRIGGETAVARAMLEETTALGVRVARLARYELERHERVVEVAGGAVRVKIGMLDGRVVNVAPEHDDCAALARSTGRAVKSIWVEALTQVQAS